MKKMQMQRLLDMKTVTVNLLLINVDKDPECEVLLLGVDKAATWQ